MSKEKEPTTATIVGYFASGPGRRSAEMRAVQVIEVLKAFERRGFAEADKPAIAALASRLAERPSYSHGMEAAAFFDKKGVFARVAFFSKLSSLVHDGVLQNPVDAIYGISPDLVASCGVLQTSLHEPDASPMQLWSWIHECLTSGAAVASR